MSSLAVFDVDETVVMGQTQRLFLAYLYKHRMVSRVYYFRLLFWFILYKIGFIKNPQKIMSSAFLFLKGTQEKTLLRITNQFYDEVLKSKIYLRAAAEIAGHLKKGNDVIFLSNAVHPIIEKLSKELNVTSYLSTRLEVHESVFTGRIEGEAVYGKNKLTRLKSYLENKKYDKIYGYGDHYSDYDFLNFVTEPHIINPDSRMLRLAQKNNWKILNFT
jgi:HAD superfamily hydrolase (TIGR01490 family)